MNKGCFKKGSDPRRHQFTREECQRGFWRAIESVIERYPNAVKGHRHIACDLLSVLIARKQKK